MRLSVAEIAAVSELLKCSALSAAVLLLSVMSDTAQAMILRHCCECLYLKQTSATLYDLFIEN